MNHFCLTVRNREKKSVEVDAHILNTMNWKYFINDISTKTTFFDNM